MLRVVSTPGSTSERSQKTYEPQTGICVTCPRPNRTKMATRISSSEDKVSGTPVLLQCTATLQFKSGAKKWILAVPEECKQRVEEIPDKTFSKKVLMRHLVTTDEDSVSL